MKAYVFSFPAHYLGGKAVIVARTFPGAMRELEKQLAAHNLSLSADKVTLDKTVDLDKTTTLYFDDGDY